MLKLFTVSDTIASRRRDKMDRMNEDQVLLMQKLIFIFYSFSPSSGFVC